MKHHHLTRALALISLLASAPAALAQTPALVPYQGRVQTGTPAEDFTGTGQFKFALVAGTANVSVQATATVTRFANNTLNVFTVTNQGSGYGSVPAVTISGGGGSGATATAVLTGDKVTSITLNNPGSGYTTVPTVTIAAPPPRQQQLWVNNGALTADPVNAVSLTVTSGLYSVLLGDTSITNMAAISASAFAKSDVRLRVWFNGTQLSPDQRLAPTAYLAKEATMFGAGHGYQQTDGTVTMGTYIGDTAGWLGTRSNHPLNFFSNNSNPYMTLSTDGYLGIGTTTPTKAKLVVDGGATNQSGTGTYFDSSGNDSFAASTDLGSRAYSIWATAAIASEAGFYAISDERIKSVVGGSNGSKDLRTLLEIQVTDYGFKDTVARGNQKQKKVIAQQVEKVYPQANSRSTGVVPDVYQKAAFLDGWVALKTDLKQGDRVRLLDDKKGDGICEVLEVKDGAFRTDFKPAGDQVFVYGREVNDFRTVDYDAISMLNVSATQELARQLDAEKAAVLALQKANATLEAENTALKAALAENTSKDKAQDEQLAALAKLLEDRAPSAAVTTVSTHR